MEDGRWKWKMDGQSAGKRIERNIGLKDAKPRKEAKRPAGC